MVVFVNRRVGALVEVLSPKDAACAISRGLRQHVQAHDATTAALGIRAGRVVSEGMVDEEGDEAEGVAQGELEEHDVQAIISCFSSRMIQELCTTCTFTFFVRCTSSATDFQMYSQRLRPLPIRTLTPSPKLRLHRKVPRTAVVVFCPTSDVYICRSKGFPCEGIRKQRRMR